MISHSDTSGTKPCRPDLGGDKPYSATAQGELAMMASLPLTAAIANPLVNINLTHQRRPRCGRPEDDTGDSGITIQPETSAVAENTPYSSSARPQTQTTSPLFQDSAPKEGVTEL